MSKLPTETGSQKQELFLHALEMEHAGERDAFLDAACGNDPKLRAGVEALLRHHRQDSFLEQPAVAVDAPRTVIMLPAVEEPGDRIGRYKLLEKIGEGGGGVVYMAEQEEPVRRKVALKVIQPGMDTKTVIARFEAERQALAMMDHPNIARVFDGGVTDAGRPYFVMELVRGIRITDYCGQHNLSTRQRLDLFIEVCSAVQHAHQKGIIHRDLKPSNILVTENDGKPVPKVIDFGIAKATGQKLTDKTLFTQFAQFIGTPAYMSPEQAALTSVDIDTRSDIYSLGVLLYELLTGTTPFDAKELLKAGFDEMRRMIREIEPPKPSTRLTQTLTAAAAIPNASKSEIRNPKSEPSGARQPAGGSPKGIGGSREQIDRDLDWIVMKCLEKDRTRRYETASGMAMDIQRHLNNEPVVARPPTSRYRFQKLVRRNKLAFAAASAVLAALIIGLGVSTWMFFKEKHARERAVAAEQEQGRLRQLAVAAEQAQSEERKKAETEAGKSRQVAKFLTEMLSGVAPSVALGEDTKILRKILDKTVESVGKDLKDQPEVEAELRAIIGDVYSKLGEYGKAAEMLSEALTITKRVRGDEHREVVTLLNALGQVLGHQGELAAAEAMLREALAMERKLVGKDGDVTTSLNNLGIALADRGKFAEAETVHREALALNRKLMGNDHEDVATSLGNLAVVLSQQSKTEEAEMALREALAIERKRFGNVNPAVATTLNNLANVVQLQNKLTDSESLFREVLELQRKLLGNAHPNVAAALNGLGLALLKQDRAVEAEPLLREGVEIERNARKSAHPQTANLIGNLGRIMEGQRKYSEAESLYREALTIYGKLPGTEHPAMTSWRNRLHNLLQAQGKPAEFDKAETKPEPGTSAVPPKP